MNRSEQFVFDLCTKSFLSLWSYPTPQGKNAGKELCDVLVVCDPDVIIFSVKEIELKDEGNPSVDWARWQRKAIDASCGQIYGAERWISKATHVITKKGEVGLPFPDTSRRRIHRVAVALGNDRQAPFHSSDFGKGLVHVFDEESLKIIMSELDTIADFIKYLADKENFYMADKRKVVVMEGEENLLAFYLRNNRTLHLDADFVAFDDSHWSSFVKESQYLAKKDADKVSYVWDRIIETLCADFRNQNLMSEFPYNATKLTDFELVIRVMAREDRFSRRVLSSKFSEFINAKNIRSRAIGSPSGVYYVFLVARHNEERKYRMAELGGRCFIVRGSNPNARYVIGIATEQPEPKQGFSFDVFYLDQPEWTSDDQQRMEYAQKQFGWFQNPTATRFAADEYPA